MCLDYCERKGENANHRDVIFSRTKSKKFPDGDVLLPFLTDFSLLSQAHFSVRLTSLSGWESRVSAAFLTELLWLCRRGWRSCEQACELVNPNLKQAAFKSTACAAEGRAAQR